MGRALKGFLAGSVVGMVLGNALAAFAIISWVDGSSLQNANRNFQLGYVAGVDDTIQTIVDRRASMSDLKQQADCFTKHHSSLGLGAFADWALTLPRGDPTSAARLMLHRACEDRAQTSELYQATVIVTGYDMRSRPSGFAQALRWVLVNVSGEPRLRADPRVTALAAHADALVASFSYVDLMAGIPYHDEQGTYDRPYNLTVKFVPTRIDKALADLGTRPWLGRRPVVVPVLMVRGFTGASYVLSAESPAGVEQRPAFVHVARDFSMQVRFPTDADFAAWGIKIGHFPSLPPTTATDVALVAGTLEFQKSLPGWVGSWRWHWRGVDYVWGIKGVNYDEAFRDIVRGVLRIVSGHNNPT